MFEHTFRTQQVLHVPLEPFVSVAELTETGLTIHTASQSPSFVRIEIARLLGWPENKVRVKVPYLGGGFGAKLYIKLEALVAALSLIAQRPVKISLTMEEQFYTLTKHAATFRIKSGVDKDGKITARDCEVWWNGGAYADIGPRVTQKSGFTAPGPYDIDNVSIDSYSLYTNLTPAGALRGFGIPQLVWAYESHTDMMARALKLDPVEFRRNNILRDGRAAGDRHVMKDAAIEAVLERLALRMNWSAPFDRGTGTVKRGRGIAIGFKAVDLADHLDRDRQRRGRRQRHSLLQHGRHGAGLRHRQCADWSAEVLNIPAESVKVVHPDTDVTPYDMATLGSRSLYHMGNAVRLAAEDARAKLAALAREVGVPEGSNVPVAELFQKKYKMQAGNIIGTGSYIPNYVPPDRQDGLTPDATPFWMVGGTGVEVEVDTETGHVKVTKHDQRRRRRHGR